MARSEAATRTLPTRERRDSRVFMLAKHAQSGLVPPQYSVGFAIFMFLERSGLRLSLRPPPRAGQGCLKSCFGCRRGGVGTIFPPFAAQRLQAG